MCVKAFEDLDEIIARYIQPMAAYARDLLSYKYHIDSEGGRRDVLDRLLIDDKRKQPSRSTARCVASVSVSLSQSLTITNPVLDHVALLLVLELTATITSGSNT